MEFKRGDKLVYLGGSRWDTHDPIVKDQLFIVNKVDFPSGWVCRDGLGLGWYHDPKYFVLAKESLFNKLYNTLKGNHI